LVDGKPMPRPGKEQQDLFVAPFGFTADRQGPLWITEPATLDRDATRVLGFDIETARLVFEHTLPDGDVRFAQDLRVSPNGRYLILVDTGVFNFTPGQPRQPASINARPRNTDAHQAL
jgi:hypothetical protein